MARSHFRLRALDALVVASGLTYTGWEDDVKEAEGLHANYPSSFDQFLAQMKKKQSIQQGDRSHEQLCALDALVASGLTYAGWEADVREAETNHVKYPLCFDRLLAEMQKKQLLQQGDRSHEQLRGLDSLVWSGLWYSDWQADVKEAEEYHVKYPSSFDQFLAQIKKKQSIQQGDRSHEQLRALDALVASGLTYAGWEADVREAETNHVKYPSCFGSFLEQMKKKRGKQTDDRSHDQLRALDALVASGLTYAGWEADVKVAEEYHVKFPPSFDRLFEEMKKKHSIQQGDRSHEQLRALDALVACGLTYAGWEADVKKAETTHVKHPSSFDDLLAEMRNKQLARGPAAVPRWGGGSPAVLPSHSAQREAILVSAQAPLLPQITEAAGSNVGLTGSGGSVVDLTGSGDDDECVRARKKARGASGGEKTDLQPAEDSTECVVCLNAKKCFVCVPCCHMCLCEGCAGIVQKTTRKCPMCRARIKQIMKVFY